MIEKNEDAENVRTTIELGRSLNFRVVAAGVETQAQVDAREEYG